MPLPVAGTAAETANYAQQEMAQLGIADWLIVGGYLALMVALGIWLAYRGGNFDDFFLAGRTLTALLKQPLLIVLPMSNGCFRSALCVSPVMYLPQ